MSLTKPPAASALELVGLTKRYGNAFTAVDAIDLRIAAGSYCCLLGPSGCGKSSTLRMIAGRALVIATMLGDKLVRAWAGELLTQARSGKLVLREA